NGSLNRNFSLLGDPSLKLALPELTIESELFPEGENPGDTLTALQKIGYTGKIIDPLTGGTADNFNGKFQVLVSDQARAQTTLGNEGPAATYLDHQVFLFRGTGEVRDGNFQGEIFIPDTGDTIREGRLKFFAWEDKNHMEASGAEKIMIVKPSGDLVNDGQGPTIQIVHPDRLASLKSVPFT